MAMARMGCNHMGIRIIVGSPSFEEGSHVVASVADLTAAICRMEVSNSIADYNIDSGVPLAHFEVAVVLGTGTDGLLGHLQIVAGG